MVWHCCSDKKSAIPVWKYFHESLNLVHIEPFLDVVILRSAEDSFLPHHSWGKLCEYSNNNRCFIIEAEKIAFTGGALYLFLTNLCQARATRIPRKINRRASE